MKKVHSKLYIHICREKYGVQKRKNTWGRLQLEPFMELVTRTGRYGYGVGVGWIWTFFVKRFGAEWAMGKIYQIVCVLLMLWRISPAI